MEYAPHELRVIEEHAQLYTRHCKLREFLYSSTFSQLTELERTRLVCQEAFMYGYERVLKERINAFTAAKQQQS